MNIEIPEHLQGPEWGRLPKAKGRLEGLARTTTVELIDSGAVKSVTLRQPGARRGIRLIHLPSLRKYLHDLANQQVQDREVARKRKAPARANVKVN
jgi:hypothetical protein